MLKRRIAFIMTALTLLCAVGYFTSAAAASPTLTVDGAKIEARIREKNGALMFPVRLVCEALGYGYSYQSGKAAVTAPDMVYTMTKGSRTYKYLDGAASVRLEAAPALHSNMLYAPASFFAKLLGLSYEKDTAGNHALSAVSSATPTKYDAGQASATQPAQPAKPMTMEDVTALSLKGEELTMADVRAFEGSDHLSGMYGWKCDIDEEYYLSCSASSADGPLLSAMLIKKTPGATQDESPGIEIRYCDVEAFVERGETVVRHSNVTKPA